MRRRIDEVSTAVGLLRDTTGGGFDRARHLARHARRDDRSARRPRTAGRADGATLARRGATRRCRRAAAAGAVAGADAAAKAAWVDGFFADGALLLIHDHDLRGLLEAWVGELTEREFVDLLPLVRRTLRDLQFRGATGHR